MGGGISIPAKRALRLIFKPRRPAMEPAGRIGVTMRFFAIATQTRPGLVRVLSSLALASVLLTIGCTMKLSFDPQAGGRNAVDENNAAVTRLTKLLTSTDPQVRAIAAVELGGMGPQARSAMSDLSQLASDPDRHVRFAAARAMTQIDPEDRATVPTLVLV